MTERQEEDAAKKTGSDVKSWQDPINQPSSRYVLLKSLEWIEILCLVKPYKFFKGNFETEKRNFEKLILFSNCWLIKFQVSLEPNI